MKTFIIHIEIPKVRHVWSHTVKPISRIHKSKRDYDRHDKSWKKDV